MQILLTTVARAVACARDGKIVVGYDLLLAELQVAEREEQSGQPWGGELVERYRHALLTYAQRYGARLR